MLEANYEYMFKGPVDFRQSPAVERLADTAVELLAEVAPGEMGEINILCDEDGPTVTYATLRRINLEEISDLPE